MFMVLSIPKLLTIVAYEISSRGEIKMWSS